MKITGICSGIYEGADGFRSLGIEGISLVIPSEFDGELPVRGQYISARGRVAWRAGKPPVHFLEAWALSKEV
mgnify:CR=1 FL=1